MGYKIKYEDMYSLLWSFNSDMNYLIETVDNYKSALDSYLNTSAMSGETADAVYSYFQEVHYVFLDSIKQIAQAFLDNFAGYKCGYYSIDLSTKFVLDEEGIEATKDKLADIYEIFTDESAKVNSAISDIDSIDGVEHYDAPGDQGIPTSHDNLNTKLTDLDTNISDFESTTVTSIDNSIETLMALFIKSLESLFVPSQVEPNRYVAGTFGENPYAAAEIYMNEILQENHDSNVEILNSIWENETELHELAEARKVQGIWKAVGGVALIVVGGACIFFSGGAATPIVIGAGTMLFGAADLAEGGQDIYHGSTGDLDTSSFNFIRDTVFDGNQTAYDIVEEVFSFAAGASIPICKAYKAGELTLRSGGVILGEEILAEGAGFGGSYLAGKYTDNPTLKLLAGVGASMLVGGAGTMVDKRFNLSGNFPKVPDAPDINPNQVKPDLDLDIDGTPGRNLDAPEIDPNRTRPDIDLDIDGTPGRNLDTPDIDPNRIEPKSQDYADTYHVFDEAMERDKLDVEIYDPSTGYPKNPTANKIDASIVNEHIEIDGKTPNGPITYVLDPDGNIIIGKRSNPINNAKRSPHPMLIGGVDPEVQCAGMITFKKGKIVSIDNQSGHFRPNIQSMDRVYDALKRLYETNPSVFSKNFDLTLLQ